MVDEQKERTGGVAELQQLRARIRQMMVDDLGQLPYPDAYSRAVVWNQFFHEELGNALATPLNQHFSQVPQQTILQMREVATGLNAQMKQLGLAIRSPATGHPSWLVAETKSGDEPDVYRYRFQETNEKGRPKRHSACRKLPELTLMPLPARIESFSKHYRRPDQSHDETQGRDR